MTGRHEALDPAAVELINQWSEQLVAERQQARRADTRAHTDNCAACADAIAYEADRRLLAYRRGELPELLPVEPFLSPQCADWERHLRRWMNNGSRYGTASDD